jgi:hypothetical protein
MTKSTNLDNLRDGLVFGLLPGWWLRKEKWWSAIGDEHQGPLLTETQWAELLPTAGFSGLDIVSRGWEEKPHHMISFMVSSASRSRAQRESE